MGRASYYHGSRQELLQEIEEARAIVTAKEPQHEDPFEDLVIRGIWEAILFHLLKQLDFSDPYLTKRPRLRNFIFERS